MVLLCCNPGRPTAAGAEMTETKTEYVVHIQNEQLPEPVYCPKCGAFLCLRFQDGRIMAGNLILSVVEGVCGCGAKLLTDERYGETPKTRL